MATKQKTGHTPGRLVVDRQDQNNPFIRVAGGFGLLRGWGPGDARLTAALMDRLAACWNALAGIENPAAVPELIEVARRVLVVHDQAHRYGPRDRVFAIQELRAALAKLEPDKKEHEAALHDAEPMIGLTPAT